MAHPLTTSLTHTHNPWTPTKALSPALRSVSSTQCPARAHTHVRAWAHMHMHAHLQVEPAREEVADCASPVGRRQHLLHAPVALQKHGPASQKVTSAPAECSSQALHRQHLLHAPVELYKGSTSCMLQSSSTQSAAAACPSHARKQAAHAACSSHVASTDQQIHRPQFLTEVEEGGAKP